VRRALTDAGFSVDKRPGFGRKRERLEATLPGASLLEAPAPRVAVIGAGIAGLSVIRALRGLGIEPTPFDSSGPGSGASGNPAALVTPAFDAGEGARAQFYAQAYRRAVGLYNCIPDAVIARGAVQREAADRDAARFDRISSSPLFDSLTRIPGGMLLADALTVDPAQIAAQWGQWVVGRPIGSLDELAAFDAVVLAAGADIRALWSDAPLQSVRGQASWAFDIDAPLATAFGGYAIPTRTGVLFGATHDRDDEDESVRPQDHLRNLDLLARGLPDLAGRIAGMPLEGRARRRAATPDRMPMAGRVPGRQGLFVLGGLGSRGFCSAPLLADHVAALAAGSPSPLPADLAAIVDPARPSLWRPAPSDVK
jgi:tRNA 5-methylaminomethyl-2-thiouridine biosynthesis bifunctional protein